MSVRDGGRKSPGKFLMTKMKGFFFCKRSHGMYVGESKKDLTENPARSNLVPRSGYQFDIGLDLVPLR